MNIDFWKMQGACNDFILVDDRRDAFPFADKEWLVRTAARRTGVGCEGIILIQDSAHADFRMRFFNPDGAEVEMCGNGARCVARLAHELGIAPAAMSIDTVAGILRAEALADGQVRLRMTEPKDWRVDVALEIGGRTFNAQFVNTGVPHAVLEIEDLDALNVCEIGRAIRHHAAFSPAGTNANFFCVTGPSAIRVRTYERGVEGETLACGTGIVASALLAARLKNVKPPVEIAAAGGDILTVDFRVDGDVLSDVTLLGPAEHVFRGTLEYDG